MNSNKSNNILEFKSMLGRLEMRVATKIAAKALSSADLIFFKTVMRSGKRSPSEAYEELRAFNAIPIVKTKYANPHEFLTHRLSIPP